MLLSIVNIPVLAEFEPTESGKTHLIDGYTSIPTLSLVYMKKIDPAPSSGFAYEEVPVENLTEGDIFYVGVRMDNFKQYKDVTTGMFSISPAIIFDTEILSPEPSFQELMGLENDNDLYDMGGGVLNDSLQERVNVAGSYFKTGSVTGNLGYTIGDTVLKDATNSNGVNNAKVIGLTPKYKSNSVAPKWQEDSFITAIYEFKVKKVPETGGKFIDFSRTSDITLTFDKAGAVKYYYYQNNAANDLSGFTKLDISKVNLFPPTYTVTYDANTGNYSDAGFKDGVNEATEAVESVKEGEKATLKNSSGTEVSSLLKDVPSKVFDGWYENADPLNKGKKIDPDTDDSIITADTTVYAHYADGYKVTFNLNADDAQFEDGTTAQKSIMAAAGEKLLPDGVTLASKIGTDPTRTGYTFEGWYTKNNGSFVQKYEESNLNAVLPESIDLYARWSDDDDANKDYRIIFDKNNGDTDADPTSVGYNDGDTLQKLIGGLPVEPTKANYKFLGWYKNASGDGERLEADTVLNNYITNGTKDPGTTVYARWGDVTAVEPPVPSSTAVTVHFAKDAVGKYDGGTYDYDTVNDKYIKYGDTLGPIPDGTTMKKDGKAFDGWYTQETGGVKVESTTTIDNTLDANSGLAAGGKVTLYPRWMDKVTVTYDANGLPAKYTMPSSVEGVPNEDFTVGNIDFGTDTYELVKWNTEADGTGTDYTPNDATAKIPASSTTLYAIWNYTGDDKVTVIFNGNDTDIKKAELTPNDDTANNDVDKKRIYTITRKPNDTITAEQMPSAARTDYTFNHWNISATAAAKSEPVTQDSITVTTQTNNDPMNIYAIWTVDPSATEITISFDVDGATNPTSIADVKIAEGDALGSQMPADPEKDGFEFGGWYIQPDNTVEADNTTTFNVSTTLKAHWTENVTVKYNVNGADTPASIDDVTKAASEIYVDPTPVPTKTGYKFIGWNTKQNGAGVYIAADTSITYADVASQLEDDKTLYAQWAAVPDGSEPTVKEDNPVEPDSGSVRVTFDENVSANSNSPVQKHVKPKYKYPKLNDSIGVGNMPDKPERENYTCEGWNTKPDGSGKTITGAELVNNDEPNYNGAVKLIDGTTDKYEVTLYAQWKLNDDVPNEDRVTINFYNSDPSGKAGTVFKTVEIFKNDALGYSPEGPTSNIADFYNWVEGDVDGNQQITFKKDGIVFKVFKPNEAVSTDMDYYAKWTTNVALYLQGYDPTIENNTVDKLQYTGQAHKPKYDLYYVRTTDGENFERLEMVEGGSDIDPTATDSPVTLNYKKDNVDVSEIKDVGTYTIDKMTLGFKEGTTYANADMTLAGAIPSELIVKEAGLTLKVRAGEQTDGQKQKKGQNTKTALSIDGAFNGETIDDLFDVKYYKVKNDEATTISGDNDLELVTEADPKKWDIGKYVIKVEPKENVNYKIGSVVADNNDGAILFYEREQKYGYPGYPSMYKENPAGSGTYELTVMGQNIVYELVASDPEIANITLTGNTKYEPTPGATPEPTTKPLELKDSDYTASKPIQTTPNPDPSTNPDWDKHYVRVDKYNESIDFEITAKYPETTTVTATYGKTGETTTTPATVTQDPVTKEWTVNIPTNIKAPDTTTVTVTMTSGDETREYTFVLQALIAGKIELAYGNSPYGEIMKADNITDKAKAKEEFDKANRFADGYIPTNFVDMLNSNGETFIFHPETWVHTEEGNMDKDDTAIFVYNGSTFKDPGFVATDAEGNPVDDSQITRTIKVNRMLDAGTDGCVNVSDPDAADAETTKSLLTYVGLDNQILFTDITCDDRSVNDIRPGVYQMNYHFIDPVTNENINVKRNVIVLFRIGDGDMDNQFTPVDTNTVSVAVSVGDCSINGAPDETNALYLYRIMDLDNDGGLTPVDTNEVSVMVSTGVNNYYFYNYLPNN